MFQLFTRPCRLRLWKLENIVDTDSSFFLCVKSDYNFVRFSPEEYHFAKFIETNEIFYLGLWVGGMG